MIIGKQLSTMRPIFQVFQEIQPILITSAVAQILNGSIESLLVF